MVFLKMINVRKRRSRILELLLRLTLSLKLDRQLMFRSDFLNKGETKADSKHDGKQSSAKDELINCVIRSDKLSEQETISDLGMNSIGEDLWT